MILESEARTPEQASCSPQVPGAGHRGEEARKQLQECSAMAVSTCCVVEAEGGWRQSENVQRGRKVCLGIWPVSAIQIRQKEGK